MLIAWMCYNEFLANPFFAKVTCNSIFVENDVFGDFTMGSNNNTVTGNDVQGTWTVTGRNNICDANMPFTDADENELVSDDERGEEELLCEPAEGGGAPGGP